MAFENAGAYDAGPGYLDIDIRNRGVVLFDTQTLEYTMFVRDGKKPNSEIGSGLLAAFLGGPSGAIVVADSNGFSELDEPNSWSWRTSVALNSEGSLIAWINAESKHENGVWIYSMESSEYNYVGDGKELAWHPLKNVLLYRYTPFSLHGGVASKLIEYDFDTAQYDTIATLPTDLGVSGLAYSPNGSRIAFFGISYSSTEDGIYTYNIDSGVFTRRVRHIGWGLSWGLRGIVYNNSCGEFEDPGCGVLWLLNTETWQTQRITERLQFVFDDANAGL